MPALLVRLAPFIRLTIQTITQVGIIGLGEKLLSPLVDFAKREVQEAYGVSDEEAGDLIANELIDALALVGVVGFGIKSKLPTILAEKLGFTAKGYVKRKLSAKIPQAVAGSTAQQAVATTLSTTAVTETLTAVAKKKGVSLATVQAVMSSIVALVGVPVGIGLLVTNTIDFGAWNSSAYQKTFQKFLAIFGLEPDKDSRSPRTTSADTFNKIYSAFQLDGAVTINDPYKNAIVPFTRDNLLDLADKLASQILIEQKQVTSKVLLASILPFIAFQNRPASTSTTTTTQTNSTASRPTSIKVFSGVVSQGVLGTGAVFTPRSNDMIDDVEELIQSCSINLANFLASLAGRVTYEIKIVSSITTKDGFTQRGSTTQVQNGVYANGAPKYKTVTNKFAVLYLYLLTDKGTRTKLATVNVGPVNSINFQPDSNDLNAVAGRLQSIVTTNDTSAIQTIITDKPIEVTSVNPALAPLPNYNQSRKIPNDLGYAFYLRPANGGNPANYLAVPDYKFYNPEYSRITEEEFRRGTGDTKDYTNSGYQIVNGAFTQVSAIVPTTTLGSAQTGSGATAPPATRLGANALTLSEWYIANGQLLPTIQARSLLYEQYGLGASALYIGSAEQNIRLLDKLKNK